MLHEIEHDVLKEMYTAVVDELLDIQLEFEEKLAEAEERTQHELARQKDELDNAHSAEMGELNIDLDKHKAAISKLGEKLMKTNE